MPANALIDTGAILSLLNRSDRWHSACSTALEQLHLPLITSQAVLTELFHLVAGRRVPMEAAWRFVRSGPITVAAIRHEELPSLHALMLRYWDRPMDYADATLVHLAARESVTAILPVDHADFETYRIDGRRRFRIYPVSRL